MSAFAWLDHSERERWKMQRRQYREVGEDGAQAAAKRRVLARTQGVGNSHFQWRRFNTIGASTGIMLSSPATRGTLQSATSNTMI